MLRVLLDQNVPIGVRRVLDHHDVSTAHHLDWHELRNGDLIAAAEAALFDVMVTCDRGIKYQQNLANRRLAIAVPSTNDWSWVRSSLRQIMTAIDGARAGSFVDVTIPRPIK